MDHAQRHLPRFAAVANGLVVRVVRVAVGATSPMPSTRPIPTCRGKLR